MTKLNITVLLTSLMLISCSTSSIENDLLTSNENVEINTVDNTSTLSTSQDAVDRHNEIRAEVFSGSTVVWSDTVATTAQEYANYLASTGKFEHDYNSGYGENLYYASFDSNYVDAINSWYGEKSNYDYNTNSCLEGEMCGHYTQIVWKDTTEIGCGQAVYTTGSYEGGTVVVCRYNPPGNYIGELPY